MTDGILKIATCQFGVGPDAAANGAHIRDCIRHAADGGADVVHFSECAMSGYAGTDFASFEAFDWDRLRAETQAVMQAAREAAIWVVLGSSHRLTPPYNPHNCLYLIAPDGTLADRYDKRFSTNVDLKHYTPGDRFVNFQVNGVTCSLLICFDLRFPEIYRALYRQGVQCILQSFYNARQNGPSVHTHIMRQTMQCRAATNHMWVSMSNSCAWFSPYPSCFIRPDGKIVKQLQMHREGVMINTVDVHKEFYDPMADFRDMALDGRLTNGPGPIEDPRSTDTKNL
ncbi:MAG: carbon-nitrogen hydrolase family protein [Phycisphaerae bacterium]|nr:carbon-nitrogen hydrolase family protein [Phycisphaerae bacterium]